MESYKLISLNVGVPQTIKFGPLEEQSAITKQSVSGSIYLSKINFAGDKQADLVNHGGPDKAVCGYSFTNYAYWENELERELAIPSFGENLTIDGLTEDQVHIGDVFRLGEAVLQVTQPRQPCFKLASKIGQADMVLLVRNTGLSGYYFRVLEEGNVSVNDQLVKMSEDPGKVSISFINHILYHDKENVEAIKKIIQVEGIAARLKEQLQGRLV